MSLQSGRKRGREEDDEGLEFLGFDKVSHIVTIDTSPL